MERSRCSDPGRYYFVRLSQALPINFHLPGNYVAEAKPKRLVLWLHLRLTSSQGQLTRYDCLDRKYLSGKRLTYYTGRCLEARYVRRAHAACPRLHSHPDSILICNHSTLALPRHLLSWFDSWDSETQQSMMKPLMCTFVNVALFNEFITLCSHNHEIRWNNIDKTICLVNPSHKPDNQ